MIIPPPVSPLPFQNNLVFSGTYTYRCGGIINWGWWRGESYPSIFFKDRFEKREPAALTNLSETPPSAVCSCCFIVFIPSFNSRSGMKVPGVAAVHHGPGAMVVKMSRLVSTELRNRSRSASERAGTDLGVASSYSSQKHRCRSY